MIKRTLTTTILNNLKEGFVVIVHGPRRVGKTVLLEQIQKHFPNQKQLSFNGDTQEARELLSTTSITKLKNIVESYDFLAVDEAQRIPNIALSLKIIIDAYPKKKIFVAGSSSLELTRGFQETLTGRNQTYRLYPLSTSEITKHLNKFHKPYVLESQLRHGGYPYLQQLTTPSEKQDYLKTIAKNYLFKDIALLKDINFPEILEKLAKLLAFQIGSEVSLNELSNTLGIDVKTVHRYLYLLKEGFIIFELGAFSRNLRNEVAKSKKYYFWDLGIRNALIDQFAPLDARIDIGSLWENFLAVERLKKHEYQKMQTPYFFWRNYAGAEIDWIEEQSGKLRAFEFKWKTTKKIKTPKQFKKNYQTTVQLVTRSNYLDFIT